MGKRSKCQSYMLLAAAVVNLVIGVGLLLAGGLLQSNLDARSDGVTELMFPLLRAEVVAVQALGFLLLFLSTVALLCVVEGTRGLYTALVGWSAAVVCMTLPPFLSYQLARGPVYLALRANWLQNLQATFVDVYSGASYTVDQYSPPYLWNHLMATYSCCGASVSSSTQNAYDYQYARWWKGSTYAASYMSNGTTVNVAETVPLWCCKMSSKATFPTPDVADVECLTSPTSRNSWIATDCGTALLGASGMNEYAWHIALSFIWALAAVQPAWMFGIAVFAITCGTTRGLCVRIVRRKGQAPRERKENGKKKPGKEESSGSEEDGDVSEEEQVLLDKKEREALERGTGDDRRIFDARSYLPRRPPQPSTLLAPSPPVLKIAARRTVKM